VSAIIPERENLHLDDDGRHLGGEVWKG